MRLCGELDLENKTFNEKVKLFTIAGLLLITYTFLLFNLDKISGILIGIQRILEPFIWGFVISYLINPYIKFINKLWIKLFKRECKYWVSLLIGYITVIIILVLFFASIIPQLVISLGNILSLIQDKLNSTIDWLYKDGEKYLAEFTGGEVKVDDIVSYTTTHLKPIFDNMADNIGKAAKVTFDFIKIVSNFTLGIIISIYMMIHRDRYIGQVKKSIIAYLPEKRSTELLEFFGKVNDTFSKFINAKIIDSIIIGILCYIGCLILRLDNSFLIAIIVGITNVIPYFGPLIGAVPCAVIVLLQSPLDMLIFIVFILVLQQFDGHVLGPKLMGDSLGLTSLWIIFAIIIMAGIFGLTGMIIGVPLFAIVYMLIKSSVYSRLTKKGLSTDTDDYIDKK